MLLKSMHKYQPRIHVVEVKDAGNEGVARASGGEINNRLVIHNSFQETQFISVTAYQNSELSIQSMVFL